MLKATIISCLVAGASAEWCIWGDKWCYGQRTTWYGLIMQYSMNLFNYILSFLWELFIVNSLISLTAIMIFCAMVAIVLYIKGMPGTLNKDSLERWNMQLAIYEYEIRYKKGKENIIADALSRLQSENEIDPNNDEDYLDILIATMNDDMDRFSERGGE
jgi:hypothetical protein